MGKFIDLTGKKFGKLSVIEFSYKNDHRVSFWKCKCDCGNEIIVSSNKLRTGHTKSCGCLRHKKQDPLLRSNLTGRRFGKLTVLSYAYSKKGTYWNCKCDCGNEKVVQGTKLLQGITKSCGCLVKETNHKRLNDLTDKRFGRLVAKTYNMETGKWHCICDCGNSCDVATSSLVRGATQSCGCLHSDVMHELNFIDITGRIFNNLKVLNFVGVTNGKYYWNCLCLNCGKEHIIERSKLGITQSCGCLDVSHAGSSDENEIKEYILRWFPYLHIEKSKILGDREIDIYIPSLKVGIEYNGSAFHATENGLYKNLDKYYHRDKFLLAKSKGIHLITVFDIDYKENKWQILERIRHILSGNKEFFIPEYDEVITDNDYDIGNWLMDYGYVEGEQIEPESFVYDKNYLVYRCGKTKWYKIRSD